MTVSTYILEALNSAGIEVVFGLPGVHALGMWNALQSSNVRYIGFRHEHSAAHAADGYGRMSGRPGVLILSTGPGTLNALSPLAEAYVSSSPVIAIVSSIPSRFVGKQKGFLHETKDLGPAFETVTRYHGRASRAQDVPKLLDEAFIASTASRPGPSLIEIPADLFDASLDETATLITPPRMAPKAEQIKEAAMLLGLAVRPVIWAGGGVIRSGATDELVRVAEQLDAPVVCSFMGKGAFPEDHRLAIGSLVRQPEVLQLLEEADLLLAIGTRFTGMDTGNWQIRLPSQMIHIDIDSEEPGRNYPVRMSIVADAKQTLAALGDQLKATPPGTKGWGAKAASLRDSAFARAEIEGPREMAMLRAIREAVPANVPTVHDMTIASYWSAPFLQITEPRTFHYPYGYGSLGFSLPASIGVAAADRSRPVVSFNGDGGFQYHAGELATIAEHRLPIAMLVFNDSSWGVLRAFSEARYSNDFAMDLPGPDFVKLAEAYDIRGFRAVQPREVSAALSDALSSMRPILIEVPGPWTLPPPADYYK